MAWEDFLNHTCDIYHIQEAATSPGYGLPGSPKHTYPDQPDVSGQVCHFGVKTASKSTDQTEPANLLEARIKLCLPYGADIQTNDKIIRCDTGMEYIAEEPVTIFGNHHVFVYIKRVDRHKEL